MKVSIIVAAYNEEKRIAKCIDSLINQSYSNIEIIIVNDGSTDHTLDIINSYDDKRIKIFNQNNKGQGAARNLGILKSTGKYIMFVDADDYVDKDIILKLLNMIKKDHSDISICNIYKIYNGKNTLFNNLTKFTDNNVINFILSHSGPVARIYDKDLFIKNNLKFVEGYINEDLGVIPLLGIYAKKISYTDEALYYYVIHDNSTTKQIEYSPKFEDIFYIINHLKKEFKKRTKNKFDTEIEYLYIEHLLYSSALKFIDFGNNGFKLIKKAVSIIKKEYPNWQKNMYLKKKSIKFKLICYLTFKKHYVILKNIKKMKK